MKFEVTVRETLEKVVVVEAESQCEAEEIAEEKWVRCDFVLDAEDFVSASFEAKAAQI